MNPWIFVVGVLVLGAIGAPVGCCVRGCDQGYSDGERDGQVVKFSRKGVFIKSWEGQLNLGGMKKTSDSNGNTNIVANTWDFTVINPTLIEQVQGAMHSGNRVSMHYVQWLSSPINMESDYEATSVEVQP